MNAERRKRLAAAIALLEQVAQDVQAVAEEEREYYDNMPEGLQAGEKGSKADEDATTLEDAAGSLQEAFDNLNGIE